MVNSPWTSRLPAVQHRGRWIGCGVLLQFAGVGAATAYVLEKARKEDVAGTITRATVRLAWHQAVHGGQGLGILIACAAAFAAGSVLLARPFVGSPVTLLVAVPLAGVIGLAALGAAVLLLVVVVLLADWLDLDLGWLDFSDGASGASRKRRRQQDTQTAGEAGPVGGP
jgi:hypothetical protein